MSLFYKASLSSSYLSFSPTVSSSTIKANHHRKEKKNSFVIVIILRKIYNGDRRQVIQRSILRWFVLVNSVFDFFFPRKHNVSRSWSVFAFFCCWMVQMRDWKSRATSFPNIQIEFRLVLIKCLEIIVCFWVAVWSWIS